ncbi:MAG: beta-propeller fold lactonase family protein [Planctomycetes bacterium]|nr:beta-propeller fold lactonase family protein [Planctomycetota bacterium]
MTSAPRMRNRFVLRISSAVIATTIGAASIQYLADVPTAEIRAAAPSNETSRSVRTSEAPVVAADGQRHPVDLVLTPDERRLITANQRSNSLSLIDVEAGKVLSEVACGENPTALALTPDGRTLLLSCRYSGDVELYSLESRGLTKRGAIHVGMHPYGLAVAPDGKHAYVALSADAQIAELDLAKRQVVRTIEVGRWPRQMALSQDGKRLAVGTSGDQTVSVVDISAGKLDFQHRTGGGLNIGQLQIDNSGEFIYFPWVIYRQFSVTVGNIRLGWVLATRIARAKLAENKYREAISLDVPGLAVGDPHGFALTPNEEWMVCSASGTHELLVYRTADQEFMSVGGPGDLADPKVYRDPSKFYRVPLGGKPMNLRVSRDSNRVFVTNAFSNSVQVVDLKQREVARTIELGGPKTESLAHRGEAIFSDARRSLDQWYSCASCHWEGGPNAVPMDTRNDGSDRTYKTVPALYNLTKTAPWTWHGWQTDLHAAMRKSLHDTMLGPEPTDDDVTAMIAYFDVLQPPPNPFAQAAARDENLRAAVERGRAVFHGKTAGCAACHNGPYLTDGKIHDVGLGSEKDRYDGFNTPSLVGVWQRVRLLHDGRAKSLEEVLTGDHSPDKVSGEGTLSDAERADLIAYLKTL